jgi:hypothetical protein
MGALVQAAAHVGLTWDAVATWGHPVACEIELAEGTPAMLKHILVQERQGVNKMEFIKRTQVRREQVGTQGDGDLPFEQAIGGTVDWDLVATWRSDRACRT